MGQRIWSWIHTSNSNFLKNQRPLGTQSFPTWESQSKLSLPHKKNPNYTG